MAEESNEFRVTLKGLMIPKSNTRQIELQIRGAALNEIATLDLKGDLALKDLKNSRTPGLVLDENYITIV
jgi:hypothetical protein